MDAVARDNERLSYERQKLVHAKARLAEDAAIKAWQDYYPTHMRYMHARDQWKKACTAWEDEKKQTARALELWKINLENRVNEFVYRVTIHGGHKTDKQMLDMFFSIYPDSCFPPQFPEIEKPVEPRAERPPPKIAYDSEWGSFESWKLINNVPYPQKRRY